MKNTLILLFVFFSLNLSWAQNKNTSWGLHVTPEMNLMHVSEELAIGKANVNQTLGISLGLVSRYHISDWFQIESGVQIRRRDYKFSINQILLPEGLTPRGEMTYTSIHETMQVGMISIPAKARISLGKGFAIDAGISLDLPFLQKSSRDVVNSLDPVFTRESEFDASNISYTVGFSQQVKLNGLVLEIGPRFDLSRHQYDANPWMRSENQFAAGFQITLMK